MTAEPVTRPVLAGNWKMHKGPDEARAFFGRFLASTPPRTDRTLVFFPPALSLHAALEAARERSDVAFGVQNVHWEASGAYTGEISAPMAAAAGARYALVGHSERRHIFGETDEETAKKVAACLDAGLTPVLCVGETLEERRAGRADEIIIRQLEAATAALSTERVRQILIAYEPVWAIGTGETASPEDASAAHGVLRARLARRIGSAKAGRVPILYGGSVKPGNAADLLAAPDVDGLLVGGASLDPDAFASIVAV